jgi:hypothetical protein
MKCLHTYRLVIAAFGAQCFSNVAVVAKAVHYARAAQIDERNSFRYTAAMEWQLAAGLFASNTSAAEYCWQQWERIMRLPRRLAGPIGDSRPVLREERTSVRQSGIERSNDEFFLATAA